MPSQFEKGQTSRGDGGVGVNVGVDVGVDVERALGLLRANVAALLERQAVGDEIWQAVAAWVSGQSGARAGSQSGVIEQVNAFAAREFVDGRAEREQMHVVEGLREPWLMLAVCEGTRSRGEASGGVFEPSVCVVEEDVGAAVEGLSRVDARRWILDERVRWFVGMDAYARFERSLDERRDLMISGPVYASSGGAGGGSGRAQAIIQRAVERQAEELQSLMARTSARPLRGRAWWAARYGEVIAGRGQPLRVMLITTRSSTFVRHSTEDLAGALANIGCNTRVVVEPDDHTRLSLLAFQRAIAEHDPELVVVVNYARANLAPGQVPMDVPFVSWVQDAMPQVYSTSTAKAQTPLDFIAGNLDPNLFTRFGYSPERALFSPVLASERKFHPGAVDDDLRSKYSCDMACVTHHSETPEALRDRLMRMAPQVAMKQAIATLFDRAREITARAWSDSCATLINEAVRDVLRGVGMWDEHVGAGPAEMVARLEHQVTRPLVDRMLRHETLAWASAIAKRRGWRLHLYGRGWERHPTLAQHARGEIEHSEPLRAAYQCARVHLHTSVAWNLHQRVMECALSGGLPLVRLKRDDLCVLEASAEIQMSREARPWGSILAQRKTYALAADHAAGMRIMAMNQRLGIDRWHTVVWDDRWNHPQTLSSGMSAMGWQGAWLLGDLAETGFRSESELEQAMEKVTQWPRYRQSLSKGIAERVRSEFSMGRFAQGLIQSVGRGVGAESATSECAVIGGVHG